MSNPILARWKSLSPKPLGPWLFNKGLARMVPYTGTVRPEVKELRPGFARVEMRDRKIVRNHLNSIHAIALVNLGEVASGLAMLAGLPREMRGIVTSLKIDYLKKARGTLTATCECSPPTEMVDQQFDVIASIKDTSGDEVARTTVTWKIGPKG
ncbi:hypothetical protein ABI59_13905 [Acidobacteria bacterium Mor1]|nr:hypothetical protein ABI59_13905 [Acidobacteria bacterium Mor1]